MLNIHYTITTLLEMAKGTKIISFSSVLDLCMQSILSTMSKAV